MKALLLSTIFIFPFFSFADVAGVAGHWQGQGRAHDEQTWAADCAPMDLVLEQTKDELRFVSHSFQCRGFRFYHDVVLPFAIRDGQLSMNEQPMGEITDSAVHIRFPSGNGGMNTLDFTVDTAGAMTFAELVDIGGGHVLVIEGVFAKAK